MNDITGLIAIICIFGLPLIVGLVLGIQWLKNRNEERMGLINQGIIPPNTPRKKGNPNRMVTLRNGITLVSLGIGIIVGFLFLEFVIKDVPKGLWVIGSSIVLFLGIGYLVYFKVSNKFPQLEEKEDLDSE